MPKSYTTNLVSNKPPYSADQQLDRYQAKFSYDSHMSEQADSYRELSCFNFFPLIS